MKTLKYILVIIASLAVFISEAQSFSDSDMRTISKSVDSVLTLYGKYSTFSQNGRNFSNSYADKFKDLFSSGNSIVVSDLVGEGIGDKISVVKYVKGVKKIYPKGIGVRISNISKEKPIKTKNGNEIHVWFNKEIFGFRGKNKIEKNPRMCMIVFFKNGNYKIVSVLDEKKQNIQNNTTSTIEFGFNLLPGYSYLKVQNDLLSGFSNTGGMSFSGELYAAKYFQLKSNIFYGVGLGIGFSTFSGDAGFSSYSQTRDTTVIVQDIDTWDYLYDVEFESTKENITFNTINFTVYPVRIRVTNILNNYELFFNGGLKFYIPSGASTTVIGKANTKGFYPDHSDLFLDDVDVYGYDNRDIENGELTLKSMAYSGIINIGIAAPFGRHLIVKVGLQIEIGLSSLTEYNPLLVTRENKSVDNYYHSILNTSENTKLNTTNLLIGIAYRL